MYAFCGAEFETARIRHERVALGDPAGERAPAAAEVEHVHPVLDPGAGTGQGEHRLLGIGERLDAAGPEAARVLAARPEGEAEELGRELVVLVVRRAGLDRDRPLGHRGHHLLEGVEAPPPLAAEPQAAVLRDRGPQQRDRGGGPARRPGRRSRGGRLCLGGSGTKTETSSW